MKISFSHFLVLGLIISIWSCNSAEKVSVNADGKDLPYRKVLKHNDPELKFQYAEKYFKNKDYYKAIPLYEELIPIWVLTEKGRDCYYRYAESHYYMKDYYLAAYYFKNFHKNNITDPRAEKALFLSALCKVKNSPQYSLDQEETLDGIDQLQLFLDRYPDTELNDTCNLLIDQLYDKLDKKKYEIAYQYYHTEYYKAAIDAFEICLSEFPESDYKEEILYYHLKSCFLLAENSIEKKKLSRYEETIKSYGNFVSAFPESRYLKQANQFKIVSDKFIEKNKIK